MTLGLCGTSAEDVHMCERLVSEVSKNEKNAKDRTVYFVWSEENPGKVQMRLLFMGPELPKYFPSRTSLQPNETCVQQPFTSRKENSTKVCVC